MSLHLIRIIAAYEMRTLLRSWFFRIFAGGAILGLGIFNIALNVEASGAPWMYKAIAASIPYANLIILNLGQAIVAVFLASEFLKQDRKNDTVEVIYARSMSNGIYILGKALGILGVFLVLNVIILLLGIGFSFISNTGSQRIFAYLAYPLLISLPTLVYILGLSFFVMTLTKNQAITFIILTGYIALTIFYLNKKAFHIFDYIAYQVPMMYSSISGFARLDEILLHRMIYLLWGIGFILLTVYKLHRLPQTQRFSTLPLYLGLVFLFAGGGLVYRYLDTKHAAKEFRKHAVALNNRYYRHAKPTVSSCTLELVHNRDKIEVVSLLTLHNRNDLAIDTLIFSLNPGLIVHSVSKNHLPLRFERQLHLLSIFPDEPFKPGDSCEITLKYSGKVDENICFLDTPPDDYTEIVNFEVFTLRKRFAFLQKDFVCLTGETIWYPVAGTTYATDAPLLNEPDFVRFTLSVTTSPELTAISQGSSTSKGPGIFDFHPEYALPRISLLIGQYNQYKVQVDSVEYSIFAIHGHEYFKPFFDQATDTVPVLIRDLKKEYEVKTGLKYPFKRFMLAEVPVHFALDKHLYSYTSDAVQPEMILCPEKGVLLDNADFRNRNYRIEREMKNNNEEALPEEIQSRMFKQFLQTNFLSQRGQGFDYGDVINWETFSVFPEYLGFSTQLQSDQWPVLEMAFEVYMGERNEHAISVNWYEGLSINEKINLELSKVSLEELLRKGIESDRNEDRPVTIRDVAQSKGLQLFNVLRARLGEQEVDSLVSRLIADYPHTRIPFDEFNGRFRDHLNTDLRQEIHNWYVQNSLPGYLIRNINSYKVVDGEVTRYQIRFGLSNPESTDGIVTLNVELNDPNRNTNNNFFQDNLNVDFSRKIFLPAHSSRDVGFVFNTEPARMSLMTHISRNLPGNLIYSFSGFTETRNVPLLDDVIEIPFFDQEAGKNETVVDNEDKGFTYQQAVNQAYLKSLVKKNKTDRYKYSEIWAWNPPREWREVLRAEFYGNFIHSAHYTRGGTGERTASWKAVLPEKAMYDVYFYMDKVNVGWRRTNKSPDYNFLIYHDNGVEKINRSSEEAENGWNYLGTFSFSSDTARVDLSNKTIGDMVFADAMKWVLNE
jgi:ABC-type transport system involved in multi-copper enzyme maturation permease subunit